VEYIGIGCTDHSSEKRKQESMFMVQVGQSGVGRGACFARSRYRSCNC
jgi:hypothetical protein